MTDFNINPPERLQKGAFFALVILSIFLIAKTVGEIKTLGTIGVEPGQDIISVSGKGEVFATADIANFTYSVDQEGSTVAEAQKKATDISEKALKVLKSAGIEDKDIKTTNYNVGPKYDYTVGPPCTPYSCPPSQNPKIVGYEVNETLSVKVRNTDKAGQVISNLGDTGVTNISSLEFTIDDEDTLKADARTKAIADARAKAEKLASDLGVSLGRVVNFNENNDAYPVFYEKSMGVGGSDAAATPPSVPLQKGQNKITVNVDVTYRIR